MLSQSMPKHMASLSRVTESSLGGDRRLSYRLALLGTYLATLVQAWQRYFLDALQGKVASSNQQTMMDLQASMAKIGTERGLGLFLSKQIPCSCLRHMKNAKENLKQDDAASATVRTPKKRRVEEVQPVQGGSLLLGKRAMKDWKADTRRSYGVNGERDGAAFKAQMRR
jgi:hypothetical protein